MGTDVTVTKQEIRDRAKVISDHMKSTVPWAANHTTFSAFMNTYNLWDCVFHQAEVEAHQIKYNQHLNNLLHNSKKG